MNIDAAKFKIVMDELFQEICRAIDAGLPVRLDSRVSPSQAFTDADWPAGTAGTRHFIFTLPSHDAIKDEMRRLGKGATKPDRPLPERKCQMPTQSIPGECPYCGYGTIYYRQGRPPRCGGCGREFPLGPPAPTEADRLRDLLRRAFPVLHYYGTPPGEQHINASPPHREVVALVLEVRAALEAKP